LIQNQIEENNNNKIIENEKHKDIIAKNIKNQEKQNVINICMIKEEIMKKMKNLKKKMILIIYQNKKINLIWEWI